MLNPVVREVARIGPAYTTLLIEENKEFIQQHTHDNGDQWLSLFVHSLSEHLM